MRDGQKTSGQWRQTVAMTAAVLVAGIGMPLAGSKEPAASWPQWGGPGRDFQVQEARLQKAWPESGPQIVWDRELGPGFSGIVADSRRLYTLYRRGEQDVVIAVERKTGATVWEHAYDAPVPITPSVDVSYGTGPNSTPLLAEGRVYTLGFGGVLTALSAADGKRIWQHDLTAAENIRIPYFGHASSPIRHGDHLIVVAGGVTAFDLESGAVRWRNREFEGSYASPILLRRGERDLLVVPAAGVIVGVDARTGKTLWSHEHANEHRTILNSPIHDGEGRLFVSAYFLGSLGLQLSEDGSSVSEIWKTPKLQASYRNALRDGEWIYAFHNSILTAINLRTGEFGVRHRGLRSSNMVKAGDRYLLLEDLGGLALVSLTPEEVTVHAKTQILKERSWTGPVLMGSNLYVRNESRLLALDLSRAAGPAAVQHAKNPGGSGGGAGVPVDVATPFKAARAGLVRAADRRDAAALAETEQAFARWFETPGVGHLARYHAGHAAWQQALLGEDALEHVDRGVAHLKAAVKIAPDFADAHAVLGTLYAMYYRLSPQRAAVVGYMAGEHISLARLHGPDNPRVLALAGLYVYYRPAQYGGSPARGVELLQQALEALPAAAAAPSGLHPDWGAVEIRTWLGGALLGLEQPDREAARQVLQEALALRPDSAAARRVMARLED